MPFVEVKMLRGRTDAQKRALVAEITDVLVRVAGAEKASVSVVLSESEPGNWAVGGKMVVRKPDADDAAHSRR